MLWVALLKLSEYFKCFSKNFYNKRRVTYHFPGGSDWPWLSDVSLDRTMDEDRNISKMEDNTPKQIQSQILDLYRFKPVSTIIILGFELVPTAFPTGPTGPGDPVGPTWPCRKGRNTIYIYIQC